MAWTDERIDLLKSMWAKEMTASQIADELGGVSRNAVIGKAHRLGLKARPSPVKVNEKEETPTPAAPAPAARAASAQATKAAPPPPPPPRRAEPSSPPAPVAPPPAPQPSPSSPIEPVLRSIGPGGFMRQGPGDQQAPIPPAPPRRLVPAKPDPAYANRTGLLDLNDRICKWPIGHPGEPDFHFCGQPVNPGFPYCVQHCGHAYQAQMPRKDRRPPPPVPFGAPRVR